MSHIRGSFARVDPDDSREFRFDGQTDLQQPEERDDTIDESSAQGFRLAETVI